MPPMIQINLQVSWRNVRRGICWWVCAALLGLTTSVPVSAQSTQTVPAKPEIQDLGNQRYRIGRIEIDQGKQRFSVPASFLKLDSPQSPLEYLAAAPGGVKSYETLLKVDASGSEFNLACILIGLNENQTNTLRYQFDEKPASGDPVSLWVSWEQDGKVYRKRAVELMSIGGQPAKPELDDWVYTGSVFSPPPDKRFMANETGTLIGFVHDPFSIIEHRLGLGIGAYGGVTLNAAYASMIDTPLTLTVGRVAKKEPVTPR